MLEGIPIERLLHSTFGAAPTATSTAVAWTFNPDISLAGIPVVYEIQV
jgi:hypothetical protein